MHKHGTNFASVLSYPTAGVNCFADWRLRGEMMGSLQEYLLGVVDDAGCKPLLLLTTTQLPTMT